MNDLGDDAFVEGKGGHGVFGFWFGLLGALAEDFSNGAEV